MYKFVIPQKGWKQKQETEIDTKKFPKVGPNSHPLVSDSLKRKQFSKGGWQFEKNLELVSVSNSYEVL